MAVPKKKPHSRGPRYMTKSEASVVREKKQVVVDREFDKLYAEHGTVTTDLVLEVAREPRHPLHNYFDWDDAVAGDKWRQAQALAMIMASKIVVILNNQPDGPPKAVAGYPQVRRLLSPFRGEGFKMRNETLAEDNSRKAFVEKRLGVLRSWCNSVVDVDELQPIRLKLLEMLA